MKRFNYIIILTVFVLSFGGRLAAKSPDAIKPNFVVIFTDDQGYADLGCFGGAHVSTPRIDKMADEGVRLTSFYVAAPVCTPSRAALMTGSYPKRVDMAVGSRHSVLLSADTKGLNPDEVTIAEVLKGAGYTTGIFGKWHLGDQPEFMPTRQGFDEYFGIPYSHDIHTYKRKPGRNFPPLPLVDGEKVIEEDPDADYLTKRITERAIGFIEKNKDKPFFLYIPHPIPHRPLHVSPGYMAEVDGKIKEKLKQEDNSIDYKTRDKLFRQAVSEIDWSVGQILDALKKNGLDDNTLVIFTSDNGPAVGQARPLQGRKGSTFEGGMREPSVIRWPGKIAAGVTNDEIMTTMDLLPTFARLAGAKIPGDRTVDGKDIWPVLTGKGKSPHKAFFYHKGNNLTAVRSGKWKLHTSNGKPSLLFDLETDIGETKNVIKDNPAVSKRLYEYIKDFEKELAGNIRPAGFVENPKALSISAADKATVSKPQNIEAAAEKSAVKPNILLIFADDLGYGDLGCYGSEYIKTPRLDAMAAEGVRFTNFYAAASICSPSRAALLTGSYPQRCGVYMGLSRERPQDRYLGLHPDELTIGELLKDAGYATLCVGKWHLGGEEMFHPMNQGFDEYYGMPFNYKHSPMFMDGKEIIEKQTDLTTLTKRYTERVVDFIQRKKDQPFFIYLPHTYPHFPYKPNPKFAGKSKAGSYGDVIEEIDWSTGVILDTLKKLGLDEKTLVIFTSDNGPTPKTATAYKSAGSLQGSKYTSWEGGHREPAIFRWPGKIPPGQVRDEMTWTMDILPTAAKLAGVNLPADRIIDGKDIWPLLSGKTNVEPPHETLFFYNCDNLQAVRWKNWKLHLPRTKEMLPFWQKRYGLRELERPILIDLRMDIAEQRNVAEQNPKVVEHMLEMADKCRQRLGDFERKGNEQRPTGNAATVEIK